MPARLLRYLSQFVTMSGLQKEIIARTVLLREYAKGDELLRRGQSSTESYLVLEGCVRSCTTRDQGGKTLDLYTEFQPILPLEYGKAIPASHFLEALEDTVVCVNSPEIEQAAFRANPEFESVCRVMSEVFLANMQRSIADLQTKTAEERYLHLMTHRKDLLERVPQYHIASYLGIQPQSLSRIRRRLARPREAGLAP